MKGLTGYLDTFERRLRILEGLSAKSCLSYTRFVNEFFVWMENNSPQDDVRAVTRQDIEGYLEWCYYRGNQNQTRLTKLIALQKFFRCLAYEQIISEDCTAMIPRPRIQQKFVQKFTKEEVLKIFRVINSKTEKGIRDVCVFILAAFCGLRKSEITNLTLNDIIDDGKSIDINIIDSKFGSSRTVYLWKNPSEWVRRLVLLRIAQGARGQDPLFVSYLRRTGKLSGMKLAASNLSKILSVYARRAGIRKASLKMHMFRATHASDLRHIQGYDIAAIAERLGHRHISTTDRYLPARGRINRTYQSLSVYWSEFAHIWKETDADGERG